MVLSVFGTIAKVGGVQCQVERVLCKDATGQRYASYSMPVKERRKFNHLVS